MISDEDQLLLNDIYSDTVTHLTKKNVQLDENNTYSFNEVISNIDSDFVQELNNFHETYQHLFPNDRIDVFDLIIMICCQLEGDINKGLLELSSHEKASLFEADNEQVQMQLSCRMDSRHEKLDNEIQSVQEALKESEAQVIDLDQKILECSQKLMQNDIIKQQIQNDIQQKQINIISTMPDQLTGFVSQVKQLHETLFDNFNQTQLQNQQNINYNVKKQLENTTHKIATQLQKQQENIEAAVTKQSTLLQQFTEIDQVSQRQIINLQKSKLYNELGQSQSQQNLNQSVNQLNQQITAISQAVIQLSKGLTNDVNTLTTQLTNGFTQFNNRLEEIENKYRISQNRSKVGIELWLAIVSVIMLVIGLIKIL
ncbi:Hypothetical_protein [Hexamita inflata]|uniref:Hypothetical_protein n=1 Tax=Hexamita inflata TaxID=28002 RepID=A0ABP1IZ71_9EUKA